MPLLFNCQRFIKNDASMFYSDKSSELLTCLRGVIDLIQHLLIQQVTSPMICPIYLRIDFRMTDLIYNQMFERE